MRGSHNPRAGGRLPPFWLTVLGSTTLIISCYSESGIPVVGGNMGDKSSRLPRQVTPEEDKVPPVASFSVSLSSGSPLYKYQFTSMDKIVNSSAVVVALESKETLCALVSLQSGTTSPFEDETNIRHRGYWLTMSTNGAITLPKEKYSSGFYLVIRLLPDDILCNKTATPRTSPSKTVEVVIKRAATDTEFFAGWLIPLLVYVAFIFESSLLTWVTHRCCRDEEEKEEESPRNQMELEAAPKDGGCWRRFLNGLIPPNFVTLDQTCAKTCRSLEKKSGVYVLSVWSIAIYYCLPAIQLVYMYLYTSHDSGNLDLCYYNFRCAYPVGDIHDFNHVYSNLGYVAAGIAAAVWLRTYENMYRSKRREGYGIPPHAGLSYALATAIFVEGVLSSCYHVCPNRSNFHHDTCFMYVAVTLTALKLYQARHPDFNMGAPTAFCLLGIIMFADLGGEIIDHPAFYIAFSLFHLLALVLLATQMYFLGRRRLWSTRLFRNVWALLRSDRSSHCDANPVASKDMVHLFYSALFLNLGLILYGGWTCFSAYYNHKTYDFGSHLLLTLGANMGVYLLYYLAMKKIYGEEITWFSTIQLAISVVLWILGIIQFAQARSSWEETPAESRTFNEDCTFYDSHDLWHMLSAFALYTTLLGLESLDIDLLNTPHHDIAVF